MKHFPSIFFFFGGGGGRPVEYEGVGINRGDDLHIMATRLHIATQDKHVRKVQASLAFKPSHLGEAN